MGQYTIYMHNLHLTSLLGICGLVLQVTMFEEWLPKYEF